MAVASSSFSRRHRADLKQGLLFRVQHGNLRDREWQGDVLHPGPEIRRAAPDDSLRSECRQRAEVIRSTINPNRRSFVSLEINLSFEGETREFHLAVRAQEVLLQL